MWLCSPVCIEPVGKSRRPVSPDAAHIVKRGGGNAVSVVGIGDFNGYP